MADAIMRLGDPIMIDYTPGSDTPAGTVVVTAAAGGLSCIVTHHDISANILGAASSFGGIYDVINLNNAANYAKVWWDNVAKKVTTTSAGNALFGYITSGGAGGVNSTCRAFHNPMF